MSAAPPSELCFQDSTCFRVYVICSSVKRAFRIVVPIYEDRKYIGNYNFRSVQESGFGSQIHLLQLGIFIRF